MCIIAFINNLENCLGVLVEAQCIISFIFLNDERQLIIPLNISHGDFLLHTTKLSLSCYKYEVPE